MSSRRRAGLASNPRFRHPHAVDPKSSTYYLAPGASGLAQSNPSGSLSYRMPGAREFPAVDDHIVEPETDAREEMVRGQLVVAMPAQPPHGDQHTLLDFAEPGVLGIFVDEAFVRYREQMLGVDGILKGQELATTFSFLRPNDLVWNYVVGNYLKGETPPPFDLLYWNSDSTNLPGPMYCWYLRNTYHENNLVVPGKVTVCGEKIDLGAIKAPVFIYASREDHIVPWDAAYKSTQVLTGAKGRMRFVLGASGHIAGVINPPAAKKRSHWVRNDGKFPKTQAEWLAGAKEQPGSWWTDWSDWLKPHGGKQVAAPKSYGNRAHKVIEPAPGRYVKQKA